MIMVRTSRAPLNRSDLKTSVHTAKGRLLVIGQFANQGGGDEETTRWPRWQAVRPEVRAMKVLPVLLLLRSKTFSLQSRYSERASSRTKVLFSAVMARKSRRSRQSTTRNFAWPMLRSVARRSRSTNSSSLRWSRWCGKVAFSWAQVRTGLAHSCRKVKTAAS